MELELRFRDKYVGAVILRSAEEVAIPLRAIGLCVYSFNVYMCDCACD